MFYDQASYAVRCEWGLRGVEALAPLSDVVIIVDVLSFSTCVEVATARGGLIFPYAWRDDTAVAYAESKQALLAGSRSRFDTPYSLSPTSLLGMPRGTRLVLPSPNGSTLTQSAAPHAPVLAGCLRNCEAVAHFAQTLGETVTVIACGERWAADHSMRPALEDGIGAGAILQYFSGPLSPEAQAAVAVFQQFQLGLAPALQACSSGRELIERGFAPDVDLAVAMNVSTCVPRLVEGAFVDQIGA